MGLGFVNDFQSVTNRRFDKAQVLAAETLYRLRLDRNQKLVDWLSDVDNPERVRSIERTLRKQSLK